jgi:di/tricarboxylate transporter
LPWSTNTNLNQDYKIDSYITKVRINPDSELVGKKIIDSFLYNNPEVSLLKLTRNYQVHSSPGKYITLKADDELLLMCNLENLARINTSENLSIVEEPSTEKDDTVAGENEKPQDMEQRVFVELLMLPGASLLGKTLGSLRSFMMQDAIPIAIKKRKTLVNSEERMVRSNKNRLKLKTGDRLLIEISKEKLYTLENMENVVILQEFDGVQGVSKFKTYFSLGVLIVVIGLAATGLLSILVSALAGVSLLLLTKNLDLNTVYKKVNWQIFFLLAGMIPLGVAMHNTGADMWISEKLLYLLSGLPHYAIIGTLFLVTMLISGVVSNNATAVIMTPIAISVAQGMNLEFKPFILAIMFAANFSFFTPVGYQTNTLVYAIGNYRFKHFLVIGGFLSLILWLTATFLLTKML